MATIGQSNVIDPGAEIHETARVGHFNVIGKCVIGPRVVIENHCVIGDDVRIGDGTRVCSHVELRSKTILGKDCYVDSGVKSSGQNQIGDGVTLRYDSIIARGCKIGDGSYICPQVMTNNLNHRREEVGGASVGAGCFIGTQSVLAAGIDIAASTVVGSCAFVTRTIEEPGTYLGVPAKRRGS